MPASDRIPASWPAWVGMTGQSPSRGQPGGELGVEGDRAGHGLGSDGQRGAVAARAVVGLALDGADQLGERVVGRGPGVQPRGHQRRHGVGAVGLDRDPAERGALARQPGLLAGGEGGHRVGEHRVVPVLHARGAGVVGLPGEVEAPAPVRPDLARQADREVAVDEVAALLDVQLDEGADPIERQQAGGRVEPGVGDRVAEEDTVAVAQLACLGPGRRAGDQARAEAGAAEARALLLDEDADPDRSRGREAAVAQHVDRRQRRHDAQRAVVRTAVEDRVEVRAGEDARPRRRLRRPPGDLVADAVGLDGEPARRALLGEPRPQLGLRGGPRLPEVAARRGRPPDRRQVAPHLLEVSTGAGMRSVHRQRRPRSTHGPGKSSRIPDAACALRPPLDGGGRVGAWSSVRSYAAAG